MIFEKKLIRRIIAGFLSMAMLFMAPGIHVHAATKETQYVKQFAVYAKEGATEADAIAWAESKGSTWHVVSGDLNAGADSSLKATRGVFLCYETTTDASEAVRDVAVMNEKGSYSESSYKRMMEEQKQIYTDMVKDMKQMLSEYRTNVNNNVTTAIQAKKLMNGYIDPDSKTRLGDLLMTIDDDKLGTLLMQANGQVVMLVQNQLSYACDTKDRTWLDRLSALGKNGDGYDKLLDLAVKANGGDKDKAVKMLDENYRETAGELKDKYADIRSRFNSVIDYMKNNGLDKMSDAERESFFKAHENDEKAKLVSVEASTINNLMSYKYGDMSLLGYFLYKDDDLDGNGIRKLYPLCSALTDGQRAALRESGDLFTLVSAAISATTQNDNLTKGKAAEIKAEAKDEIKKTTQEFNDALDKVENTDDPISVYAGVDREIYSDGGVAVTSAAENYKDAENKTWMNALISDENYTRLSIGLAAGAVGFAAIGAVFAAKSAAFTEKMIEKGYNVANIVNGPWMAPDSAGANALDKVAAGGFSGNTMHVTENGWLSDIEKVGAGIKESQYFSQEQARGALAEYYQHGLKQGSNKMWARIFTGMKWGMAVAAVLLAAADIALTVYKLYKYYNADHLPVPHHMIDISYNESKETRFINYKSVKDQDDKCSDLNGGGGRQWLALYETYDERAGEPILAPENGDAYKMIVQTGTDKAESESYSPLHMFGTPNTPQNLTFSDGDNGFSYEDKNNGTYLFFRRDTGASIEEDAPVKEEQKKNSDNAASGSQKSIDTKAVGTAVNGGQIVMIGGTGFVLGIIVCMCVVMFMRRKRTEK